jgi:cell division septum initiation protein DivIVA
MSLKAFMGKYKKKQVDAFIDEIVARHNEEIASLTDTIVALKAENARLKEENENHKKNESVISQVMFDATKKAQEIEEDYRRRADESDAACQRLHDEWVAGMQSATANLQKLREEAKSILENIDGQFSSLCTWADGRLDSLKNASLPSAKGEESIESQILKGADTDLGEICKEMGLSEDENQETESEN